MTLTGLVIGLSLITNLRWFVFLPFLLLFETCLFIRERQLRLLRERLIILFGCILIPVLVSEIPYTIFKLFSPLPKWIPTYFEQVTRASGFVTGKENDLRSFWLYFYFLWKLIGPVGLMLLVFGGWSLRRKLSKETLILLGIIFIPIFGYSLFSISRAPRNLSISLPAMAILIAKGAESLYSLRPIYFKPLAVGLTAIALLMPCSELQRILELRSNHREALEYMAKEGSLRQFSTCAMVAESM